MLCDHIHKLGGIILAQTLVAVAKEGVNEVRERTLEILGNHLLALLLLYFFTSYQICDDRLVVGDKTYKVYLKDGDRPDLHAYVANGEGFMTLRIMPGGTPMKGDELKEVMMKNLNDIIAAIQLK